MGKDHFLSFQTTSAALTGAVPAFKFNQWQEGLIAKLPDPGLPFGLDLSTTQVTDPGLKDLAGLKSLQTLDLGYTAVTDAGVKALQKALPGCRIDR